MKKTFMVIIVGFFIICEVIAQAPGDTLWTRTYGGPGVEVGSCVQQTVDDGFILVGITDYFGAGGTDFYVVKTDANGDTIWTRTYGGALNEEGRSIQQTYDGGFIIAGWTKSYGAGDKDVYLVRTEANGDTIWTNTYGGATSYDWGLSVQQTADGGFVVAGYTGRVSGGIDDADMYVVRTNANGDTIWTRTYGGALNDEASSIQETNDGGFIIAGRTSSFGAGGSSDVYLVKTDSAGDTLWTKMYGGDWADGANSVQQTTDGGYIIAGLGNPPATTGLEFYLIKTESNGDTLWTRLYGGSENDVAYSVKQTSDGGFILAGDTDSFGPSTISSFYVVRTDATGDTIWTRSYGRGMLDKAISVDITSDGAYAVAGYSVDNSWNFDCWLIKVAGECQPLNPPQNLFVTEEGYATWDAPSSRDLLGYNVYLDSVFVEYTTDLFYQYTDLINGQSYLAGVSAVYDEGESAIIEFEFNPVLDPPQNLDVVCIEDYAHFTWEAPIADTGFSKKKTKAGEEYTRDLIGYIVYLDQIEVATNIPDLEYDFYDLINGNYYDAGVKAIYEEGTSELVEINFQYTGVGVENILPLITELTGNYPNPFNPETTISFSVTQTSSFVTLEIYNIKGQKVKQLVSNSVNQLSACQHSVVWNGTDENNQPVSSGIYFYKLKSGKDFSEIKKMLLLK